MHNMARSLSNEVLGEVMELPYLFISHFLTSYFPFLPTLLDLPQLVFFFCLLVSEKILSKVFIVIFGTCMFSNCLLGWLQEYTMSYMYIF